MLLYSICVRRISVVRYVSLGSSCCVVLCGVVWWSVVTCYGFFVETKGLFPVQVPLINKQS